MARAVVVSHQANKHQQKEKETKNDQKRRHKTEEDSAIVWAGTEKPACSQTVIP